MTDSSSTTTTQQVIVQPPEFPAVPREVTPQVRRLSLMEPRVRFWLLVTGVLLVLTLYVTGDRLSKWAAERSLVLAGVETDATVVMANGSELQGRRPWDSPLKLQFQDVAGATQEVEGTLSEKTEDGLVSVGQKFKIRYDKNNPRVWTDKKTPPGFAHALVTVYLLVVVSAATGAVTMMLRGKVIRTWQTGKLEPAGVLSVATSPIAPGYSQVSVAPPQQLATTVYIPRSLAAPQRGEIIWVLTSKGGLTLSAQSFL
jgi:hypothetical protein